MGKSRPPLRAVGGGTRGLCKSNLRNTKVRSERWCTYIEKCDKTVLYSRRFDNSSAYLCIREWRDEQGTKALTIFRGKKCFIMRPCSCSRGGGFLFFLVPRYFNMVTTYFSSNPYTHPRRRRGAALALLLKHFLLLLMTEYIIILWHHAHRTFPVLMTTLRREANEYWNSTLCVHAFWNIGQFVELY